MMAGPPPKSPLPLPLPLLLLVERRLDRDGLAALASAAGCFDALPAPSVTNAARLLREADASHYAAVVCGNFWPTQARLLFRDHAPLRLVILRSGGEGESPRRNTDGEFCVADRDTPWEVIAGLLVAETPWHAAALCGSSASRHGQRPANAGGPSLGLRLDAITSAGGPRPASAPTVSPADRQRLCSLTRREQQVLEQIAGGASVRECAEALGIAESTVDNHKSRLMKKLGVRKSSELVRFAFRVGIAH